MLNLTWIKNPDHVSYCKENEVLPRLARELGIADVRNFTVDFKWIDNAVTDGDIRECMRDGDSAPGDRFRYRYIFKY